VARRWRSAPRVCLRKLVCCERRLAHADRVKALLAVVCFGGVAVAVVNPAVAAPVAKPTAPVAKPAAPVAARVAKPAAPAGPAARPAAAAPLGLAAKPTAQGLPPLWIGVFDPKLPVHPPWDNAKLTPVPHAGAVHVLAPGSGPAADGDVIVVHPILGKASGGKVEHGAVALADFVFDQRDGDDGVLVLPGATKVAFIEPSKADVAAIRAILGKTDALAGVRRALAGLELAAIDIDGDRKADVVATYGCAAWFDGSCQSKGQFFLARRGARWAILE
jgi:hypothetical protein